MTKHKWHKEIKAWADGAEIERIWVSDDYDNPEHWVKVDNPEWDDNSKEFRIRPQPKELYEEMQKQHQKELDDLIKKSNEEIAKIKREIQIKYYQPKEPQYLYVSYHPQNSSIRLLDYEDKNSYYIGKIKLEIEHE